MTPLRFALLNLLALCLTAPWPFVLGFDASLGGWPLWALYVIAASAGYAVFIAYSLKRHWGRWE